MIPRNEIDKLLILKGSSSSLSNSLEIVIREDFSLNLLSTNCFEFVYFKRFLVKSWVINLTRLYYNQKEHKSKYSLKIKS